MNMQAIMAESRFRSSSQVMEPAQADDRVEIAQLTRKMTAAWNRGDGEAFGRLFTDDCDCIAFDGTHLKGRAENIRHHQALFDTVLRGSRALFEGWPEIRFVAPDVAVMHAFGSVLLPWQDAVTPKRRSNQTYVAVRRPEGWRITAFHNTRYRPMRVPTGFALKAILFTMSLRTALTGQRHSGRIDRG
jgi:uncharacterized protein (TIGR02246 family)